MLRIRYLRRGKKNRPFFFIVVVDHQRAPQSGRFIEKVGFYDPITKEVKIEKERVEYWLSQGAKPSETVHNLLVENKILQGKKIAVHKISKKKEEEGEAKGEEKKVEKEGEREGEEVKEEAKDEVENEEKKEEKKEEGEEKKEEKEKAGEEAKE